MPRARLKKRGPIRPAQTPWVFALGLLLAAAAIGAPAAGDLPIDAVLLVDNSASMKPNDPGFLAKQGVPGFAAQLPQNSRLAVITFDQSARVILPLMPLTEALGDRLQKSLDEIDYRGRLSDSPAGLERALYELKQEGRLQSKKIILLLTDGIIDTGNVRKDSERLAWARGQLAAEAAEAGIRVFAIALGREADVEILHALARATAGEYYRANRAEELGAVLTRIGHLAVAKGASRTAAPEVSQRVLRSPAPAVAKSDTPVARPSAEPMPPPRQAVSDRNWISIMSPDIAWPAGAVVLLAVILLARRRKHRQEPPLANEPAATPAPFAFLLDLQGVTQHQRYALTAKPTLIGRSPALPEEGAEHLLIERSGISARHAIIEYRQLSYWLTDQASANGTYINGERVVTTTRLKHRDRVRLSDAEFEFVWAGASPEKTILIERRNLLPLPESPQLVVPERALEYRAPFPEGFFPSKEAGNGHERVRIELPTGESLPRSPQKAESSPSASGSSWTAVPDETTPNAEVNANISLEPDRSNITLPSQREVQRSLRDLYED